MLNLWVNPPSATKNGVTVTANADGTLSISGTSTGETTVSSANVYGLEPGKTYTASVDGYISQGNQLYFAVRNYSGDSSLHLGSFGNPQNGLSKTFAVPSSSDYVSLMVYSAGAGESNPGTYRVMLNEGSEPIAWRPPGALFPENCFSDGFSADGKHSYYHFGQMVATRDLGVPQKKSITKTVPFMSGFYDFSNLYGGIAYESREVSYGFNLLGESREDLQEQKSAMMEWLSNIHDAEIRDDDLPGWHFIGSFDSASWSEGDEGESGTLEVTFLCQPFMEADSDTEIELSIGTQTVTNDGQPVNPVVSVESGTATITINGFVQQVTGEARLSVQLPHGDTSVKVEGAVAILKWKEARI